MFDSKKKYKGWFCSECGENEKELEDFTIYHASLICFNCCSSIKKGEQ